MSSLSAVDRNNLPPRHTTRARPSFRYRELPWTQLAVVAALFGAAAVLFYTQVDIEALPARAARLPAIAAFALLLFLPLVGFPVSVLHVAAGIRFGAALGLPLVVLSIAIQIVISYAIVQRWRGYFERARWLSRLRRRIPRGAHTSVCIFTVLLPGAPYSAINYTLPLLGVPLRTLLLYALPIHAVRCSVTVLLGDQIDEFSGTRLTVLLVYALTILTVSWWTYRRLQSRFEDPPPAEDGRRQPA